MSTQINVPLKKRTPVFFLYIQEWCIFLISNTINIIKIKYTSYIQPPASPILRLFSPPVPGPSTRYNIFNKTIREQAITQTWFIELEIIFRLAKETIQYLFSSVQWISGTQKWCRGKFWLDHFHSLYIWVGKLVKGERLMGCKSIPWHWRAIQIRYRGIFFWSQHNFFFVAKRRWLTNPSSSNRVGSQKDFF